MEQKFYKCEVCGNIVKMVKESGVPVVCCGQNMTELVPCTSDGAVEKHVPVFEVKDHKVFVRIGEAAHPMLEEHHIEWISIQTNLGSQRKVLVPGEKPEAVFPLLEEETVEAVYAYCNLHGLWKK